MKNFAAKATAAILLSTAAASAFATWDDPDCKETPQYPNGTPACHAPAKPTQTQGQTQGQNQGQIQGQNQGQGQTQGQTANSNAAAAAAAAATSSSHSGATASLVDNSKTTQTATQNVGVGVSVPVTITDNSKTTTTQQVVVPVSVTDNSKTTTTQQVGVSLTDNSKTTTTLTTGNTSVKTGDTNLKTGDTTLKTGDTTLKTGDIDNKSTASGNKVEINDNSVRQAAASTAMGIAPGGATNLDCGLELRLGAGAQSLSNGTSVSVAIPLGRSESCRVDGKWKELARSPNEVDQALKHELAAEMHPDTYGKALDKVGANIEALSAANGGKDVVIQPNESHRLLGGGFAKLRVKPTVVTNTVEVIREVPVTVAAPAVAVAAAAPCVTVIFEAPAKGTAPAAVRSSTPKPAVSTTCSAAELDKARAEGAKAAVPALKP